MQSIPVGRPCPAHPQLAFPAVETSHQLTALREQLLHPKRRT
ncbi:hypothetical protein [Streptomyces uncialis]